MSVIQLVGTKVISVSGQSVSITATVEKDDVNGQLFLRIVGVIGVDTLEYRHSIGAGSGADALAGLSPTQIVTLIQTDLDQVRNAVAQKLATLAAVKIAAATLV